MVSLRPALATACLGVLLLSACSAAPAASPSADAAAQGQRPQQARMNGTFGLIADLSSSTLQVQGESGQTAVTYTDATAFTQQKAGTVGDLTVGACVTVRGEQSAEPSASDASAAGTAPVVAASITVTPAENGECSGGGFGGRAPQGGMPSGEPPAGMPEGALPSGAPEASQDGGTGEGRPDGAASGRPDGARPSGAPGGGGGMVMGIVESAGDGTLVVKATRPGSDASQTTTVTYTDAVAVTTTADATASALAVGRCAFASGEPDDTGAVEATAIRISDAVDGACTRA